MRREIHYDVGYLLRASAVLSFLLLTAAPQAALPAEPAQPSRRILILHSYHPAYNWSAELTRGLMEAIGEMPERGEVWVEYLDAQRLPDEKARARLKRVLAEHHGGRRFDVVIGCDDAAVEFLLEDPPAPIAGTPVVFCGVGSAELISRLPRQRFTGVRELDTVSDFLAEVLQFLPQTKEVVLIADNSRSSEELQLTYKNFLRNRPDLRLRVLDGARLPVGEIIGALRRLDRTSLVILTHFTTDQAGRFVSPNWMAEAAAGASGAPVVSPYVSLLGQGLLAGNRSSGIGHGYLAGRMAHQVLSGIPPQNIPVRAHGNLRLTIDDQVAARWGVPRWSLPGDAEVVNQQSGWRALSAADWRIVWGGLALVLLQMITIVMLVYSIWSRKRAERELETSRQTLERAQRIAHVGLWSRDPSTGKLVWSDEVYRIFGVDPSSVKPSYEAFLQFVHPADRERIDAIVRASDARRQSRVLEFRMQLPGGVQRHVRSVGEWSTGTDGKPVVAGIVQDITELKHTEELLRQMQRMESVGTLAGGVAHDFNNLLTVINGYSQLLAGALPPGDPRFQHVREIQRAGERAAELTRQLLAFSRKQILSPRLFDLNQLVRDSEGMLKPVLGARVGLVLDLSGHPCLVHADPLQIEQVLINLAANARDAMPDGGCFRIRTSMLLMREFSGLGAETIAPGRYVEILVCDDGCGMDEETRRRVFEPFFTTKPEGKGTGLGLASVYGIVRQSGGWITVSSEQGAGTAFRILLPSAEGALPPQETSGANEGGSRAGRVLVLDHHPQTGEFIGLALRQAGFDVEFAADEQRLSHMMETAPEDNPFRVLLVDLRMWHVSGLDLARRLRRRFPHLRTLLLFGEFRENQQADLEQGEAVLDAPVTPAALADAVRALLAQQAPG